MLLLSLERLQRILSSYKDMSFSHFCYVSSFNFSTTVKLSKKKNCNNKMGWELGVQFPNPLISCVVVLVRFQSSPCLEDKSNGLMSFHFPSLSDNIWQLYVSFYIVYSITNSPSISGPFFSFLLFFRLCCAPHRIQTSHHIQLFLILIFNQSNKTAQLLFFFVFFSRKDTICVIILV